MSGESPAERRCSGTRSAMLFATIRIAHAARQLQWICGHPLSASACTGAAATGSQPATNLMIFAKCA